MKKNLLFMILSFVFVLTFVLYAVLDSRQDNLVLISLYMVPVILALIFGFVLAGKYGLKNQHGRAFFIISIGVALWFIGELLWFVMKLAFDFELFPSFVDVVFLLGYPLIFWGFVMEFKTDKHLLEKKNLLIPSIITVILAIFIVYFGIYGAYSTENSFGENFFGILYGVADFILAVAVSLVLIKAMQFSKGKMFLPWLLIALCVLLNVFADMFYSVFYDIYDSGGILYIILDMMWVLGYYFLTYAFISMIDILKYIQQGALNKLKV